jgi:hypothetical protein
VAALTSFRRWCLAVWNAPWFRPSAQSQRIVLTDSVASAGTGQGAT